MRNKCYFEVVKICCDVLRIFVNYGDMVVFFVECVMVYLLLRDKSSVVKDLMDVCDKEFEVVVECIKEIVIKMMFVVLEVFYEVIVILV